MSEDAKKKKGRGGDVKRAPDGYYTAKQAQQRLGMTASTFRYYVLRGKIKRHIPPMKVEGYYKREEIDELAAQMELFVNEVTSEAHQATETRVAQPADAQGIVEVLTVMGWQTATADQRVSWYKVNPLIDYVAVLEGKIAGYIHAAPMTPQALEDLMSGERRSWHMQPQDFQAYEPGKYDIYVGIATVKSIPHHTQRVGFRLISGFFTFLTVLAKERHVFIHRLYAISDQDEGMRLCRALGFTQQPAQEGDKFPRWMLDLETSDIRFAQLYREAVQSIK